MRLTTRHIGVLSRALLILAMVAAATAPSQAFTPDTYRASSRLATGRWVKISVDRTGLYLITTARLREMGFNDASKVRIHGYGGRRISDVLTLANYTDDLPPVPMEVTQRGIVFYGQGPDYWTTSRGRWVHSTNPFSLKGYYFLTEDSDGTNAAAAIGTSGSPRKGEGYVDTFTDFMVHEQELTKLGETGHMFFGEDFKWTRNRTFTFSLTDIAAPVTGEDGKKEPNVTFNCAFVAKTPASTSRLSFTANDSVFPSTSSDVIPSSGTSGHTHGQRIETIKSLATTDNRLQIGISYTVSGVISAAHLDYIEVNYLRTLRMPSDGIIAFNLDTTSAMLHGAKGDTRVWDVTNPLEISRINAGTSSDGLEWTADYTGLRRYVAWNPDASFLTPGYEGTVANQDLHAAPAEHPDMVIFTLNEWASQAERIAELHRTSADSLNVLVVNPAEVYNEFASGVPDVNAMRRYLKMLYDRGNASGHPLRYALLMGKPTFDNRRLSSQMQSATYPTLPTWQSDTSLDDNSSFTTDDIFAFLEDGAGASMGSDKLCIAVGRIPVRTASDAKNAVDKIYEYIFKPNHSSWRNQIMLCADDDNNGIHMHQSEKFYNGALASADGDQFFYTKVYIDAFEKKDGGYPGARTRMFNRLDDGTLWWSYIGHANPTSWTGEKLLTYLDINNMYQRNYPVLYAATCEFLNWDSSSASGAEILYFTRQGGIIAAITAVRPVFIGDNGYMTNAMSNHVLDRDDDGRFLTIGEIYRRAKNSLVDDNGKPIVNNVNKLRFVLMGDPAMRFSVPRHRVVLDRINGVEPTEENQVTIKARQRVVIEGHIADVDGNPVDDFDGSVSVELYDAEHSTTSNGNGEQGAKITFEEQGEKLYAGRDSVSGGRFTLTIAMPDAVAENFRPAAINMYAAADDGNDAMGINRSFYVYGYDENAEPDTIPPTISSIYLNHPTFINGSTVNASPMLIARISDDTGFNLSSVGVGHSMTLQVDGSRTFTDVSQYYTPDLGSVSGVINYPIDELTEGHHTLRLRVWDTDGNPADATVECFVNPDATPELFEVYTDANPASVEANFYVSHNRPDSQMTVTIEVFNLLGQPVWSSTESGRSDMFTSSPVTWDLTDMAGRRVGRGIYLYRASLTADGEEYVTKSSRIAVTGE